jgi:CheY-like chemotaxis protein
LASDGLEAVALYADHHQEIAAVLMDSMMPTMDGLTTTRNLQKINPQVKVIAMSGLAANNLFAAGPEIGIAAFLAKPYTVQELLDTLQQVLKHDLV